MKAAGELTGLYRWYEAPDFSAAGGAQRDFARCRRAGKASAELAEQLERIQTVLLWRVRNSI